MDVLLENKVKPNLKKKVFWIYYESIQKILYQKKLEKKLQSLIFVYDDDYNVLNKKKYRLGIFFSKTFEIRKLGTGRFPVPKMFLEMRMHENIFLNYLD